MMDASEISRSLAAQMPALCSQLYPSARIAGRQLRLGSIVGEPGGSCVIELAGERRGYWFDHATGDGGDALDLVAAVVAGGDMRQALDWSRAWLGDGAHAPAISPLPASAATADDAPRPGLDADGHAIWNEAQGIDRHSIAARYLAARRCVPPPADGDLRWHERIYHWPSRSHWPALVALISDAVSGEPLSLHYTFIARDGSGKAPVQPARLYLPRHRKRGGVVRLWPDAEVTTGLLIGEGLETTLTAARVFRPAWAALDAGNLAGLPVLAGIESLTVLQDDDPAGRSASETCARAWFAAGRETRIWEAPRGD